jgi:hypothetical protein
MPTTKRARRHARGGANSRSLTECQREILLFGFPFLGRHTPSFKDEKETRQAWQRHRTELMSEWNHPGERPDAFWRFDVVVNVRGCWWKETRELEARGLLTPSEELRVEKARPILSGGQSEHLFAPEMFAISVARELDEPGSLRRYRGEFELAAGWHESRGRVQIATKYGRLLQLIDEHQQERAESGRRK